ncbi:uridine phosphorylase [Trinickia symbiotica]|uniref:Uridine phosphorylase n=1 Tax=Trinickia symbiotica TaxID=863227 RepID=A0A2N7X4W8_9BURK|nr:nucleoside phosphorylase [Trinickia symbiotica]PMS36808.1 uridine phosphorylase [Trinickia symbiotica]PPK46261.1 uridine phosphorylase [Trinickia symbiotica]PTB18791.1 uridine phosphorylase [Trinickia symbiotica]
MNETESVIGRKKRHVEIGATALPRCVLLPGDPARVPVIGSTWDRYEDVSFVREYRLGVGAIGGISVAACSTGIGGPSTEIAVLELAEAGPDTFIRVGTCAALQEHIRPGDLVIQHSAVRLTGTVDAYVNRDFPSVADLQVTNALIAACNELGIKYHVGMTASVDSFYGGQGNPLPGGHSMTDLTGPAEYLRSRKVATFEMEAATLFVLGSLFGLRTGSVCVVGSNRVTNERLEVDTAVLPACTVASMAAASLSLR